MALVRRESIEQHVHELVRDYKPMRAADLDRRRKVYEDALLGEPDLMVQKVRRTERPFGLIEITCRWVGMDTTPQYIEKAIAAVWPGKDLPETIERFAFRRDEEIITMLSGEVTDEGRYATVRLIVQP